MSNLLAGLVSGGAIPTVAVLLGVGGGWITVGGTGYSLTSRAENWIAKTK